MGLLIITALFALSVWCAVATFHRLRKRCGGRSWWLVFGALGSCGLVAGWWLAFRFEYQPAPEWRFFSFPLPLGVFHLENGHWIDFVPPPHVMYPGVAANVAAIVALAVLPLLLASFRSTKP